MNAPPRPFLVARSLLYLVGASLAGSQAPSRPTDD
jgi:hypothetical protein